MSLPPIRVAEPVLDGRERQYVLDCLDSSWISSRGEYIERFESLVARFCQVRHAVATNNGTTALHLALAALGLGPGDEVLVPTLTYVASINAIRYCGATPVLVDSQGPNLAVDPQQLQKHITPRTRGIVTVPLYGHPVDFDPIAQLARQHGLFVVEDAAEAFGARYRGQPVGSLGTCATFSFFGNKIITTGEGGMVVTNDSSLADRLRHLRGQAVSAERFYWHTDVGFNYRMTNIAAAIGCAQMEAIDRHLEHRRAIATWYHEHLQAHQDRLILPDEAPWAHHCYWMYTVLLRDPWGPHRDAIMQQMAQQGIETRPVFYPVHLMPPYREPRGRYPVAEYWAARGINLPTHGRLTAEDVARVSRVLVQALKQLPAQPAPRAGDPERQAA